MRIKADVKIPPHYRTLKLGEIIKRGDLTLGGRWWEEVMFHPYGKWVVGEGELVIRRVRAAGKGRNTEVTP